MSAVRASRPLHRAEIMSFLSRGLYVPGGRRDDCDLALCKSCLTTVVIWLTNEMPAAESVPWAREFWKSQLRTVRRDFWVQAAAFITLERDEAAMDILGARLIALEERCSFEWHQRIDQVDIAPRATISLSSAYETMSFVLLLIWLCIKSPGKPIHEAGKFGTRGAWPTSQRDLLPRGPDESTRGLLALWRLDIRESDFVMPVWIRMCLTTLHTHLIQHRHVFVDSLVSRVRNYASSVRENPTSGDVLSLGLVLKTWHYTGDVEPWRIQPLFRGRHIAMSELLENIRPTVRHAMPLFDDLIDSLLRVHRECAGQYMAPGTVDDFSTCGLLSQQAAGDVFQQFLFNYRGIREHKQCDFPTCNRYGSDESVTRLQLCARCRVFRYCSRACQQAHWTSAQYPHKASCPKFAAVQRAASLNLNLGEFSIACRANGVTVDQLAELQFHAVALRALKGLQVPSGSDWASERISGKFTPLSTTECS